VTAPALRLDSVTKRFGSTEAVSNLTLAVARGEFVSLLGPSGCGKTTTLRMIAGLERPSSGSILIAGQDVSTVPPEARDIGMVFQSLALFPHMTVAENIAFGLRMRQRATDRLTDAVRAALARVRLPGFEDRYPESLSGGQQQRVALARALVTSPAVLLLDEPFSALDRSLREELTLEFAALLREIGATTVFVTHDQEEAFSMSDRVAVIDGGRLMQCEAPSHVFSRPASARVAQFVGMSNLLPVTHQADGGMLCNLGRLDVHSDSASGRGRATLVGFRPEDIEWGESSRGAAGLRFTARISRSVFRGRQVQLDLEPEACPNQALRMMVESGRALPDPGSVGVFTVPQDRLHLMEI
jgi:ABC-type Fe3+/spermidine/putrescine transport system ATPase subunit